MAFQIAEVVRLDGDVAVGPWVNVVAEGEYRRWRIRAGIDGGTMRRMPQIDPQLDPTAHAWQWRPQEPTGRAPRLFLSKPLLPEPKPAEAG